jgi:transcriptional regulator with XRE-family HTH domain
MASLVPHHYDRDTTRAAVQGAVRAELAALGDRLSAFRGAAAAEMERLAALRWVTDATGIRGNEVAERAGVSRQTLANLRSEQRGTDYHWPPDLRVLIELGINGPQSTDQLTGSIGTVPVDPWQVTDAIDRLAAERLIAVAGRAASGTTEPVVYWRLTAAGVEDLPRRLQHAAMPPSQTWTAYVRASPAEGSAIAEAGQRALGEHGTVVIPAGTVHGMTSPEVAFWVEAPHPQAAQAAAIALFRELRRRAGMTERQEPIVVTALVPPSRHPAED